PHRRGRARLLGGAGRGRRLRDFRHASGGARARRRGRRARRGAGSGGAAVARLRQLRPVQEFRGQGRRLSRGGAVPEECRTRWRETLMVSRVEKGPVANWWWTIDRWFFAAFLTLMGLGVVLSFAASPAVAERIGLDSYHFVT